MTSLILIVMTAFALVFALTPGLRNLASRIGSVDRPNQRKFHSGAIPLLGGVGIYVAVILAILVFGDRFYIRQAIGILVGGTIMSFTGLWDDHRELSPLTKLLVQIVASVAVVATGIQIELFPSELANIGSSILWFILVSNAFNLIDNTDGLSAGIAGIASFFFLVLAAINGQYLVGMLSAAMLGACLGFLFYNFNPATIFMGDAGSLLIGFMLAATGIKLRFPDNTRLVTWMVPIIILAVPFFDTLFVSVTRIARGQSILVGGKDHVSHRLLSSEASERKVVFRLYIIGAVCGAAGVLVSFASILIAYAVLVVILIIAAFMFGFLADRA